MGDTLPAVALGTGRFATAVAAGSFHTCALLDTGTVKCWGNNSWGQLGQGDATQRGSSPGQMGDALPPVALGTDRTALAIGSGYQFACALLDNHTVKCWGDNTNGQLGQGTAVSSIGDGPGELGDAMAPINLGTGRTALKLFVAQYSACAALDNGALKCWGANNFGQLGLGDTTDRGTAPAQMGDSLPPVALGTGRTAMYVSGRLGSRCAMLDSSYVKCWGRNNLGQLGLGTTQGKGGNPGEMGDALPVVDIGP
jgi:alpha-tubulin suppressor-like RCC1 family protein